MDRRFTLSSKRRVSWHRRRGRGSGFGVTSAEAAVAEAVLRELVICAEKFLTTEEQERIQRAVTAARRKLPAIVPMIGARAGAMPVDFGLVIGF
jgi:hypothetical protein